MKIMALVRSRLVQPLRLPVVVWMLSLLTGCGSWVQVPVSTLPGTPLRCDEVEVLLLNGQRLRLEHATLTPPNLQGEVVWVETPTTRTELGLSRENLWRGALSTVDTLQLRTTTNGQKSALSREGQVLACWDAR